MKALQVWSVWFLFLDAYVNGLGAFFLPSRNLGVPPFHSICGDAPPLKNLDSSKANITNITNKLGPNQDVSLMIGEGAKTQEFFSIPLLELER